MSIFTERSILQPEIEVVSKVAQQLGVSTRRLRALEEQALQNILDRGRRIPGQEPALPPKDGSKLRELPQRDRSTLSRSAVSAVVLRCRADL